jgi:hypothetical protein
LLVLTVDILRTARKTSMARRRSNASLKSA